MFWWQLIISANFAPCQRIGYMQLYFCLAFFCQLLFRIQRRGGVPLKKCSNSKRILSKDWGRKDASATPLAFNVKGRRTLTSLTPADFPPLPSLLTFSEILQFTLLVNKNRFLGEKEHNNFMSSPSYPPPKVLHSRWNSACYRSNLQQTWNTNSPFYQGPCIVPFCVSLTDTWNQCTLP